MWLQRGLGGTRLTDVGTPGRTEGRLPSSQPCTLPQGWGRRGLTRAWVSRGCSRRQVLAAEFPGQSTDFAGRGGVGVGRADQVRDWSPEGSRGTL